MHFERLDDAGRERLNRISSEIIGAAVEVHSVLGPGLLERAYEVCLARELRLRGHIVRTQVEVPVVYEDACVESGFRLDMLIDDCVVVELKASEGVAPVHKAQLLSYLRLTGH